MSSSIKAFDPLLTSLGPLRDPRSRSSLRAATRDMARVGKLLVAERGEILDADLVRAGFTPSEMESCHAAAMAMVAGRALATRAETVLDMAAFMALTFVEAGDGAVTRHDLHRGGFTEAEIDDCFADAQAETRKRLAPRQSRRAA